MNKDKAIQLLERLQDPEPYEPMLTKDAYDAIQMAIDALSADGDTISRTSLMSELKDMHHEAEKWIADAKNDDVKARAESCLVTITEIKLRVDKLPPAQPEQLGTNLAGVGTDCISRQAAIDALDKRFDSIPMEQTTEILQLRKDLRKLPSAQPERTCVSCGRTVNNGGWYADGGTRCPIEEHYALPKDGYCHLWEKRNVTDDDYPERREE